MSYLMDEIASQPECWSKAIELAAAAGPALPRPGERVAAVGCGSSLNVARCYAALREAAGHGRTDAFPASEFPATRRYDCVLYISRTGTTTEVLDSLRQVPAGGGGVAGGQLLAGREARHRGHRLVGRRHDLGPDDLRADFQAREDQRRLYRGRRLPSLHAQ